MKWTRREMLGSALAAPGLVATACAGDDDAPDDWARGAVRHLLPTASSTAFNVKLSVDAALPSTPMLRVGGRAVAGQRQDSTGRFWAFRVGGLEPSTEYTLELRAADTRDAPRLCAPWPLRTLPAPGAQTERLRVAAWTCAGGPDVPSPAGLFHPFKPPAYRRRLFDLALEGGPDVVIANGDHVYFDLPLSDAIRSSAIGRVVASLVDGLSPVFDPARPVYGGPNEDALVAVGDDQITQNYGVRFRSTPVFFVTDDHDYFVNDDATPEGMTLPPAPFHRQLRDALQRLYFPEFIADASLPGDLPGRRVESGVPLSTHFGALRFGDLFEALFYDCGGHLSIGRDAGLVPPSVEAWLHATTRREDTRHLVHVPSHPLGWTAGKWREWYPDALDSTGSVVAAVGRDESGGKFGWQSGWWSQHQRLVRSLTHQARRAPIVLSGDLHALGAVDIMRSGELDLRARPLHSILAGPVGVGDLGWPSRARGVVSRTPADLEVGERLALSERNGFAMLDVTREGLAVELFGCPPGWTDPSRLRVKREARLELGA